MSLAHSDGSQKPGSEVITADEVAALLRMTPAWVYAETRRNRIPHMRLGRYFRYRRSAIDEWMRALEESSARPGGTTQALARPNDVPNGRV
jgi:excisionase family DNA binding protein